MSTLWVGDVDGFQAADDGYLDRGECYKVEPLTDYYPEVVRPIGFMRDKPRVRVKAWTMPIIKP